MSTSMGTAHHVTDVFFLTVFFHLAFNAGANVHILESMRSLVLDEGSRAKFICKVDVHHLDQQRLKVTWRSNGRDLRPETTGRLVYKHEGNKFALIIKKTKALDTGIYTCVAQVGLAKEMTSARLQIKVPPDPPESVRVTSCHGNSAELEWDAARNNGAEILSYSIQFNTSDNPKYWYDHDDIYGPLTRLVTLQLYPWGTYSFRVKAKNMMGSSRPSEPTTRMCTTPPDRPDRNPTNVRTSTRKKRYLIIEWTPMSRLYFHGPRFHYEVRWRMKGTVKWNTDLVKDPSQGSFEVETSDVYRKYEMQVKARNSMGESHQPAFNYVGYSGESEPLVAPSNFSLNPDYRLSAHTAHFIWSTVNPSNTTALCGRMKGYKLRYWKASEGWNKTKEVEIIVGDDVMLQGGHIKVALADLPAFTALKAQVAVMNTHFTGPYSDEVDFFTPEGVPSKVTNLRLKRYGVAYVLLKWQPPQHPNGIITAYDVAYQQVEGVHLGKVRDLVPSINDTSVRGARINGLTPNRHYRFIVWARTHVKGEPAFIDVITAKGDPPHAPQMKVSKTGEAGVNVTWMADQAARDLRYQVAYRHAGQSRWRHTEPVYDQTWMTLDPHQAPVNDLEVRLVASNRLGDTATSKTVALATKLKKSHDLTSRLLNRSKTKLTHTNDNSGVGVVTSQAHYLPWLILSPLLIPRLILRC